MPKVTTAINAMTAGELSPRAKGRFDLAKYSSGVGKMENFLINQLGGASFRPGTRFLAETKDSSKASRLIPFQYQADQDYVVEMGDLYMKMYENDGDAVVDTQADTWTKLLIHANGVDGSKEIQDSGNTGHIPTQNGNAVLSIAKAKFGLASLLLDGNGDYITVPDHADWNFGTGDFTIDFWVYFNAINTEQFIYCQRADASNYVFLELTAANKLSFDAGSGGSSNVASYIMTSAWSGLATGAWHHIALVRNTTSLKIYIDGVSQALTENTAIASNTMPNVAADLIIGTLSSVTTLGVNGYLDEFRVSKGLARWTADFNTALPTAYTSDANTQLLLHFESLDTSSATAPKIPTFVGTAQLDTAQYKDLTGYTTTRASILLDGDSDYVTIPDSADWDFGTGDFTIDMQVRFAVVNAIQCLIEIGQYTTDEGIELRFDNTVPELTIYLEGTPYHFAWNPSINTWYHLAVTRTGTDLRVFVDGTQIGSTETNSGDIQSSQGIGIGRQRTGDSYVNGWLDEIRISKGIARWTANFTAPTAEWDLTPTVTTEIVTTYVEDDIFDVQYAQNNDIMYLVHPDYAPRKLSRTSATAFSLSLVSFVRGPFLDDNTTATTITPSSATGNTTLTASADLFDALHVGSLWRIAHDATHDAVVKITAVNSATEAVGAVQAEPDGVAGNIGGTGAYTTWAEGAFSAYRGYPSAVAFHEQRLYYANTEHEPQKLWASVIASYDNFDADDASDDDAITFEVATEQRNAIKWLSSGNKSLTIGAQGGTFSASSGDSSAPIAPDNIMVNRDSNYGCAGLLPKRISSFLYYIQRDFLRLRELSYSFTIDATISSDMTLLAEHILKDGTSIVDIDHQQSPNDRIWCVRDDGEMAVLTRNPEQDIMGWCRIVAGTDSSGQKGEFESVCVIPKQQADDQVWVIVKRSIGGTTKRFIEYFSAEDFDEDWDAIQCDSSLSLDSPVTITGATAADPVVVTAVGHGFSDGDYVKINGVKGMTELNGEIFIVANKADDTFELTTADGDVDGSAYSAYVSGGEVRKMVTNISGLSHLEGETVVVQTDGYIPSTETYVVSGGGITLSARAAVVHAGLTYSGEIDLLKLSDGSATGTGQTKTRRIYKGTLRLYRSQGLKIGRTSTTLDDLNYDDTTLFTGDADKVFQTTWYDADEIIIKQTKPLPASILAIIFRSETEE